MDVEKTKEPAETLQNMWQGIVGAGQDMAQPAEHLSKEGKYFITLQPTRDGQRELLTLEVTPAFRQDLEGLQVVLVNRYGKEILRDTISGGTITRLIDRQWRDTWPFRVQAD